MASNTPTLQQGEVQVVKLKRHWIVFIPAIITFCPCLFAVLLSMTPLVFLVPFCAFIFCFMQYNSTSFILTNKNIRGTSGNFKLTHYITPLKDIKSIVIHVTPFSNFFNYGTIVVSSDEETYTLKKISRANVFKENVLADLERVRK